MQIMPLHETKITIRKVIWSCVFFFLKKEIEVSTPICSKCKVLGNRTCSSIVSHTETPFNAFHFFKFRYQYGIMSETACNVNSMAYSDKIMNSVPHIVYE